MASYLGTPSAQYRGGAAQQRRPPYVAAWLRIGEIQAEGIKTEPFDTARFKAVLADARKLVQLPIKEAVGKLAQLCASAGVALFLQKKSAMQASVALFDGFPKIRQLFS